MAERDLQYFSILVETGSYTATSNHFGVTQPAISASLHRLEKKYGVPLMTQQNHRAPLVTTAAGQVLYVKARNLSKEMAQIALEVKHANEQQVRMGFSHVAGGIWLPKVIERLVKAQLLESVTTKVAHSGQLLAELRSGKLDAAVFSSLYQNNSNDLHVTLLESHSFSVLVNRHNPLSKNNHIGATDLMNVPIIARPQGALPRLALDKFCERKRINPNILYEADSNQIVESLVSRQVGIGFVISNTVSPDRNVVEIPLKNSESIRCYMQLALRNSFLPNAEQRKCLDLLTHLKS
ncbi:LysR family transcriptional regulator [uncultured Secundilactobacillus sp.]|uniref:LysR family transcriptional regulator n=1 Tax=uncultured Secundilactobacillus sp. TaxID=2813935 RepID=UPI00258C8CCF|nr:LysR family transcriptional regulator [uncultured Secundilactobacillus sp.]